MIFKRTAFAAMACLLLASAAEARGWESVHRYVHPTGRCGAQREVIASWYCESGGPMAGGGRMNCARVTAASWQYRMHSTIRVTNPQNGRTCNILISDTGPNGIARRMGDVLDLSSGAADCLGTARNTVYVCAPRGNRP
jgi:rare lipoprotein A (peptidoglycan hydrolase)